MGMWDSIIEWFGKEEKKVQDIVTDNSYEREEKFLQMLEDLKNELTDKEREKYDKNLENALPDKVGVDYLTPNVKTDEEIQKEVNQKLGDTYQKGKEEIDKVFDADIEKVDSQKKDAYKDGENAVDDTTAEFDAAVKKFREKAYKNGILDSSIVLNKNAEFENLLGNEISDILKKVEAKISGINEKIDGLEEKKQAAFTNYDKDYSKTLQNEIDLLTKDRDKKIKEIDDYNARLKALESQYQKDYQSAKKKFESEYSSYINQRSEDEKLYGYAGDRKENYDKRVEIAVDFYKQFPKEVREKMYNNNLKLREYLGYNWTDFSRRMENVG